VHRAQKGLPNPWQIAVHRRDSPEPAEPNQPPTLGRPSPAWPISSTAKLRSLSSNSKSLTETKLLEQTASILGISLAQLVKAGTLVYAKREFLNHNKYSAAEGGDSKVCSLALRFGRPALPTPGS
jgi:hypothetical protein